MTAKAQPFEVQADQEGPCDDCGMPLFEGEQAYYSQGMFFCTLECAVHYYATCGAVSVPERYFHNPA